MKSAVSSKLQLTASMLIFSSIGIFVKYIPMPSSVIAFARGLIGMIFLLLVVLVTKNKISLRNIKRNILVLALSGAAIGFNWIFLFEAYKSSISISQSYLFLPSAIFSKSFCSSHKKPFLILSDKE